MAQTISILGCGWLGLPLGKSLVNSGYHVKGSTTTQGKIPELLKIGIQPYLIDLTNREDRNDFLTSDVLIIAIPHKSIENFIFLFHQIEKSTVKRLLFISSTSVYPNTNAIVTEESHLIQSPLSHIECLFKNNLCFKSTIVRFGGLFGGERKPGKWFKEGAKIKNPKGFVNLIHQDDCIRILKQIVEQQVWGEIFNACADTHPSRREFYSKEMQKEGRNIPAFEEGTPLEYKIVSNQKLKVILNYIFVYPDLMNYD